jgi:hypothetical protein
MRTLVFTAMILVPGVASAGELHGIAAGGAATSSWEGDGAVLSMGKVGYRLDDKVGFYAFGSAGYAGVQRRVLTSGGAGLQLWTRYGKLMPYVRGALVRQHERSLGKAMDDPLGTLIGTEDDIRQRSGVLFGAGIDLPLWRVKGATFFASADASVTSFRDDLGPQSYWIGTVGLGVNLDITKSELR